MTVTYTHFSDLAKEVQPPGKGTLSRTLFSDDRLKAVAFGFAQGEELSEHRLAARRPALPPGRGEADAGRQHYGGAVRHLGLHAHGPAAQHPGKDARGHAVAAAEVAPGAWGLTMPQTPHVEWHFTASETVRDIVIGMSDGLTVPFALAAGLSGAVEATGIIITAGLDEVAAGAIAMGLGGYLAARTDAEHFASERAREERETKEMPEMEAG
jgi:hypothetical protein